MDHKVDRNSKDYIKHKKERIKNAKQDHKYDFPNPRSGIFFPERDFVDFKVIQEGKEIKLTTYRYKQIGLEQPKALLLLFHGLNSSVSHGSHIAKAFAQAGFCVVGFDHRGFGASEGERGYIESQFVHLQDCRVFVDKVEQIYGVEIKKFVCGLSMGGMSSYNLSLEKPYRFAGAILMAPAIKHMQGGFLVKAAQILEKLSPKWNVVAQKGTNCHRSIAIAKDQMEDPNSYIGKMCGSTVKMILGSMETSNKTFEQYNCPFLIIQGSLDKLVDPDVGFELVEKSPGKDKTHIYLEGTWHDIWHEPEIVELMPKMVEWAQKRI